KKYPLIVFSKSYCPYSRRAKALLESYNLSPAPFVIELDSRSDGPVIQAILRRLTGRGTVPNVILQAKAIGGSDDIQLLDQTGELKEILK
ncbi:thioredoxin-like protein, partial [Cristinia sonorae]